MQFGIRTLWLGIPLLLAFSSSTAQEPDYDKQHIQMILLEKAKDIVKMASSRLIIDAVEQQNSQFLSIDIIKQRDKEWVASGEMTPLKRALQENNAGVFFKSMVLRNLAIYSEVFLTDNQGANVAAYPVTSDYWQGDEAKFTIAFNQGKGQLLITPVIFDESARTYAAQVAVPVYNKRGETIGVLFVGIKLSYVQARGLTDTRSRR